MKFVLVNDRKPRGLSACACCGEQLGLGYLREMSSNHVYCSHECYGLRDSVLDRARHATRSTAQLTDLSGLYVDWAAAPTELY